MIYDKIDNIDIYAGVSDDSCLGLEWLRNVNSEVENSVYEINPSVKTIVSEYTTKEYNENGYEAHRDYIDIQFLISGEEKICCLPLEYLEEIKPYNEEIDAAFYEDATAKPQELMIGNGYFTILYSQDGHMPQMCVKEPIVVKKVVVKVKLEK